MTDSTLFKQAITAVRKAGYHFLLSEGTRTWLAIALGPTSDPRYTRALGCGKTADEAMDDLIKKLQKQSAVSDQESSVDDLV